MRGSLICNVPIRHLAFSEPSLEQETASLECNRSILNVFYVFLDKGSKEGRAACCGTEEN